MTTPETLEPAAVAAQLRNLDQRVYDLEARGDTADTASPADERFAFDSTAEFVESFLLDHVERRASVSGAGEVAWCPTWWRHPEVALRFEALWRTFEAARLDPFNGIAAWILQQLDPHMAIVLSPRGPLGRCTGSDCVGPGRLESERIPAGHPLR